MLYEVSCGLKFRTQSIDYISINAHVSSRSHHQQEDDPSFWTSGHICKIHWRVSYDYSGAYDSVTANDDGAFLNRRSENQVVPRP